MKAHWLQWPFQIPVRPHQRQRMVHSRAVHPSTITVLLPQIEEDAKPDCWCGRSATLVALVHQIDACQPKDGLTPSGAEVHLCCAQCARLLGEHVAKDIEKRLEWVSEEFACRTCRKPINSLHSVMEMQCL